MAQIYFSSLCYCLLLIITQCSSLVFSLCSFGTIAIPFNFQPTIFSAKMQYNRPCKYSRPWLLQSSAYEKKNSNVSIFILRLSSSLYFGDNVRYINVNSKFRCFSVLGLLKQSRFDFSIPKQAFVEFQLLEIDYGRSLFSDYLSNASKTFSTLWPYYRWLKTP